MVQLNALNVNQGNTKMKTHNLVAMIVLQGSLLRSTVARPVWRVMLGRLLHQLVPPNAPTVIQELTKVRVLRMYAFPVHPDITQIALEVLSVNNAPLELSPRRMVPLNVKVAQPGRTRRRQQNVLIARPVSSRLKMGKRSAKLAKLDIWREVPSRHNVFPVHLVFSREVPGNPTVKHVCLADTQAHVVKRPVQGAVLVNLPISQRQRAVLIVQ